MSAGVEMPRIDQKQEQTIGRPIYESVASSPASSPDRILRQEAKRSAFVAGAAAQRHEIADGWTVVGRWVPARRARAIDRCSLCELPAAIGGDPDLAL